MQHLMMEKQIMKKIKHCTHSKNQIILQEFHRIFFVKVESNDLFFHPMPNGSKRHMVKS